MQGDTGTGCGQALSVRVFLIPNGSGFDAVAADLPGTVSYGDSEADALKNIEEAIRLTLDCCDEMGVPDPWVIGSRPDDATLERQVILNA